LRRKILYYFNSLQESDAVLFQLYSQQIQLIANCQAEEVIPTFKKLLFCSTSWTTDFGDLMVAIVMRSMKVNCITYDTNGSPMSYLVLNSSWPDIYLVHQMGLHFDSTTLVTSSKILRFGSAWNAHDNTYSRPQPKIGLHHQAYRRYFFYKSRVKIEDSKRNLKYFLKVK
jgi:hypothetical protein